MLYQKHNGDTLQKKVLGTKEYRRSGVSIGFKELKLFFGRLFPLIFLINSFSITIIAKMFKVVALKFEIQLSQTTYSASTFKVFCKKNVSKYTKYSVLFFRIDPDFLIYIFLPQTSKDLESQFNI